MYTTKQQLLHEIEQLPISYILELHNFLKYLQFKNSNTPISLSDNIVLPPENDPLLRASGMIDVKPFSKIIDDTLYGAL